MPVAGAAVVGIAAATELLPIDTYSVTVLGFVSIAPEMLAVLICVAATPVLLLAATRTVLPCGWNAFSAMSVLPCSVESQAQAGFSGGVGHVHLSTPNSGDLRAALGAHNAAMENAELDTLDYQYAWLDKPAAPFDKTAKREPDLPIAPSHTRNAFTAFFLLSVALTGATGYVIGRDLPTFMPPALGLGAIILWLLTLNMSREIRHVTAPKMPSGSDTGSASPSS